MTIIDVVIAVISALGGGGLTALLTIRYTKNKLQLNNKLTDIEVQDKTIDLGEKYVQHIIKLQTELGYMKKIDELILEMTRMVSELDVKLTQRIDEISNRVSDIENGIQKCN